MRCRKGILKHHLTCRVDGEGGARPGDGRMRAYYKYILTLFPTMSPATSRGALFREEYLARYPKGIGAVNLRHAYSDTRTGPSGAPIDFKGAVLMLDELKADVAGWYKARTGKAFDPYALGADTDAVRERFWSDRRFAIAFSFLQLGQSDIRKARIPWWNELAGTETGHRKDGDGYLLSLGPRHSLETQLVRSGVARDICSVSVAGLIMSADGMAVIGLRGGATYPNTYHVNAGALGITEGVRNGSTGVYDFYREKELGKELGLTDGDISGAFMHARLYDTSIENGTMYVFLVRTGLTFRELESRYESNIDEDKGEHTRLVGVDASDTGIMGFIAAKYRGIVANKDGRGGNERFLLHPGAMALLSLTGRPLSDLAAHFREGTW